MRFGEHCTRNSAKGRAMIGTTTEYRVPSTEYWENQPDADAVFAEQFNLIPFTALPTCTLLLLCTNYLTAKPNNVRFFVLRKCPSYSLRIPSAILMIGLFSICFALCQLQSWKILLMSSIYWLSKWIIKCGQISSEMKQFFASFCLVIFVEQREKLPSHWPQLLRHQRASRNRKRTSPLFQRWQLLWSNLQNAPQRQARQLISNVLIYNVCE